MNFLEGTDTRRRVRVEFSIGEYQALCRALSDAGHMTADDSTPGRLLRFLSCFATGAQVPAKCEHTCTCGHSHGDHSTSGFCNGCMDPCEHFDGHYPTDCPQER